ncbi:NAD(P)/FAD-dependent oxidoreductase [Mycobacterium sp. MYCO198283]|uniref:NAD(P)/FAD-dependent oxidoreductase n=1 Tax=Mycobacterium sp. MYCO198283 TaxID=2883505 RepID=UPI001E4C1F2D|nr:NAD(P)/FAD-dependent oxidoreductase [Mycobacterium sp. MYCO198283]MCG5433238.1 NAD(P)/FAD-dependent oxidoreductase [Mycobacterium sp. MYCO198283]
MASEWDCIVVGGGAAGLSAALVLGRSRRRTLLVDAGEQSNLAAPGVGGLLGHDGRSPAELYALARHELTTYPDVTVEKTSVTGGQKAADGFVLTLADGRTEQARRVLLSPGMDYRPPELPGLPELWGNTVFHCPFCHGWEVRDRPLAALARGEKAIHTSLLLRGWSDDVVLLTNGPCELDDANKALVQAAGVQVDERPVARLESEDGELSAVVFADGDRLPRRGLLVETTLHQRTGLAEQFGAELSPPGPVVKNAVAVDDQHRTTVPGLFAAGDASAQTPQVANAIASGLAAAASVVQSLLAEDVGLPFETGGAEIALSAPV